MEEKRKLGEESILKKKVFSAQQVANAKSTTVLKKGVFEDVLRLSCLMINVLDNKSIKVPELKKQLHLLELRGIRFSPFVKRFVLQNLPVCIKEIPPEGEKKKNVLNWMHQKALNDATLLHVDFVEYNKILAKDFSSMDKDFFLNVCSITEQLVSSDSKKTMFKSPDIRINEIENDTLVKVSDNVKSAVKNNLFYFKRERIHLSRQKTPLLTESYALLKKMCQKYFVDITSKGNTGPFKNKAIRNGRVK